MTSSPTKTVCLTTLENIQTLTLTQINTEPLNPTKNPPTRIVQATYGYAEMLKAVVTTTTTLHSASGESFVYQPEPLDVFAGFWCESFSSLPSCRNPLFCHATLPVVYDLA
jgi:hypothetical protein